MQQPLEFYTKEKQSFENELAKIKKKLTFSSMLRLVVFLLIVFGVYFLFGNAQAMMLTVLIGIAFFLFLVSKHTNLQHQRDKIQALIDINTLEIEVLKGNKTQLDFGDEYKNPQHEYSYDIDLFGNGSFFQYINRTSIKTGKDQLAKLLTANDTSQIEQKQEVLKELAKKPTWRQNFSATASLVNVDVKASLIVDWLQHHKNVLAKYIAYLPTVFFIISLSLFGLKYFDYIGFGVIIAWFFIGLGITGLFLKNTTILYQNANHAKETFKQYHQLLLQIENESFSSEILKSKQEIIKTSKKKASQIFKEFSKVLDAFDQRNNILFGIFGNAFALWDIKQSYKIEQWIANYHHQVAKWFDVIAYFDAQNSLANYVFNHPKHCFPTINPSNFVIVAKQLGHPLLNEKKRVDNDFSIENQQFFIITGANMAGKSTFLRTVSLSIVMANMGLPVCATSFDYSPIKLITSMRTSDSLTDDESYFFSELKRLKYIVDLVLPLNDFLNKGKKNQPYFIILDEILKGTNSKDKAIGSRKFVERLVDSNATGIIATHDLSLCEITKELPQVKNHYFDAEIINDELYFDYTFKDGICQNMNASFLLKKMKIV